MKSYTEPTTKAIDTLQQLKTVAGQLSQQIRPGDVVFLQGDLGSGKTTFTQKFLAACGITEVVKSPTYTLYETYQLGDQAYLHMDLYRLTDPEELYFLGIEDLLDGQAVVLIEWPGKGAGVLPTADWTLEFRLTGLNRTLTITSNS